MHLNNFHPFSCLLAVCLVGASVAQPPQATVVDGAVLKADAGNDFFERGRNLYEAARQAKTEQEQADLFGKSIEVLDAYLLDFPKHANAEKAWWYLGSCYQQVGKTLQSRRCFRTLITHYQQGPWVAAAAYALAADHYNLGEYAAAAPLFERYASQVEKKGEKARGLFFAGNCYRLAGLNQRALAPLQQVVEDPDAGDFMVQAKLALGHLSVSMDRTQDALERFVQLAELEECPDSVKGEALLHAALAARKLKKRELAGDYLERVMRNQEMKAQWLMARSALMANCFELEDYGKVVELGGQNVGKLQGEQEAARLMMMGRAQMRLKKPKEALSLFRAVERLVKPDSEVAFKASFYRLLCFYDIQGEHVPEQVDAFLQLYEQARPNDSLIHTALMMKAESLFAAGKVAEAAQVYNKVDATRVSEANQPGLHYQRGWCLAEAGDQVGALRSLSRFIAEHAKDSRIPSALAKRAKVFEQGGKSAKAIADYDRLIKLGKPPEMLTFAWLESARLRRASNQIDDMIVRYQGLLDQAGDLEDKVKAEAHYWIGWGLVKSNKAKDSIGHLEQARSIRPELYRKHSGILLALGYFAAQNADKLAEEVTLAIEGEYQQDLPEQAIQWSGMQSFNAGDFQQAATFLALITNPEEPRETPKEVWRYLGKAQLNIGQSELALVSINNTLEVEENAAWRADGLLDRGRALLELEKLEDARKAVDEALGLQPQGRTRASLRILAGDLDIKEGDPKKASAQYLIVVGFVNDKQLKPLALSKLIAAQEALGELEKAENYRQQLLLEFPDWKAP